MKHRISILAVVLILLSFGCAKDVGEDNIPKIANVINTAAEGLAYGGLILLAQEKPEEVEPFKVDIAVILSALEDYQDGVLSVDDLANTVSATLNRLNERFEFLDQSQEILAVTAIAVLKSMAEIWISDETLPEEVGIYTEAFSAGIRTGLDKYNAESVVTEVSE